MKKMAFLSALLAVASVPIAVQAQEMPSGSYIGLSILSAHTRAVTGYASSVGREGDTKAPGAKLYSGVMWGNWGLEADIYYLGQFKVAAGGVQSDEFEAIASAILGTYTAPVGETGIIGLRAGVARVSAEYSCVAACLGITSATKTSTVPVYGFSVGWRMSQRITVRMDFDRFSEVEHATPAGSIKSPYKVASLGAQFNF